MLNGPQDLAQIRFDNAMRLFEEFVQANVSRADAATLRGLEGRFAERLQIQASYWSQIKARSRQIGERLARQFEERCSKPNGWLDEAPESRAASTEAGSLNALGPDERFLVDLVLTYYRRDPERARARLLGLLGDALQPAPRTPAKAEPASASDEQLWSRASAAVAPLKRKRGGPASGR